MQEMPFPRTKFQTFLDSPTNISSLWPNVLGAPNLSWPPQLNRSQHATVVQKLAWIKRKKKQKRIKKQIMNIVVSNMDSFHATQSSSSFCNNPYFIRMASCLACLVVRLSSLLCCLSWRFCLCLVCSRSVEFLPQRLRQQQQYTQQPSMIKNTPISVGTTIIKIFPKELKVK